MKKLKKISIQGYTANEKIRYGTETMATVRCYVKEDVFAEFECLIIAAPEMLEALEDLYTHANLTDSQRIIVKKAIDKARGVRNVES